MRVDLGRFAGMLFSCVGCFAAANNAGIRVAKPHCEYTADPIGLDTAAPRFSWILQSGIRGSIQTGYHILVASSSQALASDEGDKWDSGKVASDRSVNISYGGSPLSSGERCYWKVKVWDNHGSESAWSAPSTFEMGLLRSSDWHGQWIAAAESSEAAPLLRKTVQILRPVKRARVYISGLGWYELYLNGRRGGDHVLDPAMTEYPRRILYVSYDITSLLKAGENAVGVMLGNGWFSQPPATRVGPLRPHAAHYGTAPQLLFEMKIEYTDGASENIFSDESWRTHDGPITRNGLQSGESYDARLEIPGWADSKYDDARWPHARRVASPGGRLQSQVMPPIKIIRSWKAVKFTNPKPGIYVYDFGRVITGWTRLRVRGPRDATVALLYSERIFADTGLLDKQNHPVPQETDYYTLKGDPAGETYSPRFAYHPFRYVQLEGFPGTPAMDSLECQMVHSAIDESPAFESSNPLINKIHDLAYWTIQNALYGMPMDEPHREPYPYLEPGETPANLFSRRYMPLLWTKWLEDSQDAQHQDGSLPETVPDYMRAPIFDPAWAGNYPIAVWFVYQYYDDRRILESHYPNMKRWVDYLTSIAGPDHLITKGHLGDHMLPGVLPGEEQVVSNETPPQLCWMGYYYRGASILSKAAALLGNAQDARHYQSLAAGIKRAFNSRWFDPATDRYATGSQTSNLFALSLDLVPDASRTKVTANIATEIAKYTGHLHTGIIGVTAAMDTLANAGYGPLLYDTINNTTYPGWGYMVDQGATTIWERWSRMSNSHMRGYRAETMTMFATIDEFMFGDLAGIKVPQYFGSEDMQPGFREIHIRPVVPAGLQYAKASFETVRGRVSAGWRQEKNRLVLNVSIPANSTARVDVPKPKSKFVIRETGKLVWHEGGFVAGVAGVVGAGREDDCISFHIGSGTYSFQVISQ